MTPVASAGPMPTPEDAHLSADDISRAMARAGTSADQLHASDQKMMTKASGRAPAMKCEARQWLTL
jgi:hypothetical protein